MSDFYRNVPVKLTLTDEQIDFVVDQATKINQDYMSKGIHYPIQFCIESVINCMVWKSINEKMLIDNLD